MDPVLRASFEQEIRAKAAAGDVTAATTAALEGYGPEILRFLLAFHRTELAASEVFSLFTEGLWRGIAAFDWSCTLRTWAFAIARRASLRYRRDQGRRAARELPLEVCKPLSAIEDRVRTSTLSYLRTARRNRFAELRDALPEDERALLMLRVDQKLAWNECARALHDEEAPLEGVALRREAARLRKRYQLVKEKLLEIGRREGLVGHADG